MLVKDLFSLSEFTNKEIKRNNLSGAPKTVLL